MKLKVNTKAPNFKLPSTSKDDYSLKIHLENMLSSIFIQRMIRQGALLRLMILINHYQNLKIRL
jgi:hypothetical protein